MAKYKQKIFVNEQGRKFHSFYKTYESFIKKYDKQVRIIEGIKRRYNLYEPKTSADYTEEAKIKIAKAYIAEIQTQLVNDNEQAMKDFYNKQLPDDLTESQIASAEVKIQKQLDKNRAAYNDTYMPIINHNGIVGVKKDKIQQAVQEKITDYRNLLTSNNENVIKLFASDSPNNEPLLFLNVSKTSAEIAKQIKAYEQGEYDYVVTRTAELLNQDPPNLSPKEKQQNISKYNKQARKEFKNNEIERAKKRQEKYVSGEPLADDDYSISTQRQKALNNYLDNKLKEDREENGRKIPAPYIFTLTQTEITPRRCTTSCFEKSIF